MSRSARDYLRHILHEAEYLAEVTSGLSREDFLVDETLRRAFARSIEVVGEAAKLLSPEWRDAHPEVDWRALAGMRDRLIHGYLGVDYELVWEVASTRLPALRPAIAALVEEASE
ncbi:MAG: DUF86 domain-containing protein [Gemmatimonadota bacterium]